MLSLGVLVLLGHAWLLGALPAPGSGQRTASVAAKPPPLQVRQLKPQLPLPASPVAERPAPPAKPRRDAAPTPATARNAAAVPAEASASAAEIAEAEFTAPAALPGDVELPVYTTRLPPPVTLQYAVLRGERSGIQAELRWQPEGGRYTLSLGIAATGSASVGDTGGDGLLPERQVETRRGRERRAVNFQRDSSRITFSGPQFELPLPRGAQDRLSWLIQLAAVMAANPAFETSGQRVSLFVVGPRGDAAVWAFISQGVEAVELPTGTLVTAVHLRREVSRPQDTRAEVWLDPARHHLPVRLRLQYREDGESTELLLQAADLR